MTQIEEKTNSLLKDSFKLIVEKPSRPLDDSQLISHFGGMPYFEKEEEWPTGENGQPLDFIFQIYNENSFFSKEIKLIQFYYDWEEMPWDNEDKGWLVKVYKVINSDNKVIIERPSELDRAKFCLVKFAPEKSLPDWESLYGIDKALSNLSQQIDTDEPWGAYSKIKEKMLGREEDYYSWIGGYPHWLQGESVPLSSNGKRMSFLMQIDSEENADIFWSDQGLVYLFFNPDNIEEVGFTLQSL